MEFSYTYFEDEVREGFYVPGIMKRAWAAQLEMLEDIRKVCEKHQIPYFAEWGTLLGAVRHGGFIPWDDDLDICMKRSDYNRFLAIAEKELPTGYKLLSFRYGNYWEMLTRVVSGDEINFDIGYLEKFHGFPYIAGIDIFPLDYVAPDEQEEKLRTDLVKHIMAAVNALKNGSIVTEAAESLICQVEEWCNVSIDRSRDVKRQLYMLVDQLFSLYREDEADEVTLMPLLCNKGVYRFPKNYYENTVMLPFENTMIPVPAVYDAILRIKYGDYMKPVHNWDSHDYPFFKKQISILSDDAGILPHKYIFSMEDLRKETGTMNKTLKKRAFEMAGLIDQAHTEIKNAVMRKNIDNALEYLEGCQNSAVSLGTLIENSEGEEFVTVHLLEEYCELVYQMHTGLMNGSLIEAGQFYDRLCRQINCIKKSIQCDIKERMTAVFLPYKASMWDSLESIWQAADADPDCDAYVIPIPYYDKNPDGSFREMHYEGDQYPDYVPVTKYDEFNFELRRPDMIFIHNPYDQCNHVTSVHPFFYSKNLKQFTKLLVYLPYFILDEINPNDKRAIANMEHFVTVPGVIQADQVIVQSEDMRQTYIRALTDFAGEQTRRIWEKKILGIGSPKIDKVMYAKKEDFKIPDEWMRLIVKQDGRWKKIVLYNTSVSALLQYGERMIKKIQNVLELLEKSQDNIVLIWRPHPLINAALKSLRLSLWNSYEKIVTKYCTDNWGIYDQTPDVDRAINLCDVYYGDISSVTQLCQFANKPIMIQHVDERNRFSNWNNQLVFLDCSYFNNRIWIMGRTIPGIFSIDTQFSDVCLEYPLYDIDFEEKIIKGLSLKVTDQFIYAFAENSATVYKINRFNKQMSKITIECIGDSDKNFYAEGICEYNNNIFIIPSNVGSPILKFDGNKLEACMNWKEEAGKLFTETEPIYFTTGYACNNNELWTIVPNTNTVVQTDLDDLTIRTWQIQTAEFRFETIAYSQGCLWMISTEPDAIICWKQDIGIQRIYYDFPAELIWGKRFSFTKIIFYKHKVWFIPGSASCILILDLIQETFTTLKVPDLHWSDDGAMRKFFPVMRKENLLYLFAYSSEQNLVIDMDQEEIILKKCAEIDLDDYLTIIKSYSKRSIIIDEHKGAFASIVDFAMKCAEQKNTISYKNAGEKIWESMQR